MVSSVQGGKIVWCLLSRVAKNVVFLEGYTVFTLSDRVSETFLCPKRFCVRNVFFF